MSKGIVNKTTESDHYQQSTSSMYVEDKHTLSKLPIYMGIYCARNILVCMCGTYFIKTSLVYLYGDILCQKYSGMYVWNIFYQNIAGMYTWRRYCVRNLLVCICSIFSGTTSCIYYMSDIYWYVCGTQLCQNFPVYVPPSPTRLHNAKVHISN